MDNRIELSKWETKFLELMHFKLENGVLTEGDSQKIEFKKINIQPYLLNNGEKNKDSILNQKIEIYYEGYNYNIVITRYGNVPGPMTITIGINTYGVYVQDLDNGLKKVKLFRSFNNKMASIEAIPNFVLPNSEEYILLTRLSNEHGVKQSPEYTSYITCSEQSLKLVDNRNNYSWRIEKINKDFEVSFENYKHLLETAISRNYKFDDSYRFFEQEGMEFLLSAYKAVELNYCNAILNHKMANINKSYDDIIATINDMRDREIFDINQTREKELAELNEQLKVLQLTREENKRK